jgi:DNA primase
MESIERWAFRFFEDSAVMTGSESDIRVDCPFCGDTKKHLYISTVKPVAHCFKCEWRGSWLYLVKEAADLDSYAEAAQHLTHPLGLADYETVADRLSRRASTAAHDSGIHVRMPEWFVPFSLDSTSQYARMILTYALRRVTVDDVFYYGMGYCSDHSHVAAWRLIIPIERGFWTARSIMPHVTPKYLTPEFSKRDRLFNPIALTLGGTLYVAEGVFSGIALGKSATAVLGKSATDEQAERLAQAKAKRIVVAFDADARAGDRTMALADHLMDRGKTVLVRRYAWGDPEDCELWNDVAYDWGYRMRVGLEGL